jgi:hypothetical protein
VDRNGSAMATAAGVLLGHAGTIPGLRLCAHTCAPVRSSLGAGSESLAWNSGCTVASRNAARKDVVMSSESLDDERLLTKGEVAQLCRVDVRTVDRWRVAGKVGCQRTPSGRVLFKKRDVLTAIDRRRDP